MKYASPPAFLTSATVSAPSFSRRPETTTLAPSAARATATARPIPEVPPVTRAILFSNVLFIGVLFSLLFLICGLSVCGNGFSQKLLFGPPSPKRFDQLHRGHKALPGELGIAPRGLKGFTAGVHDFEVAHDARAVAVSCEVRGAPGICDRAFLGHRLLA